MANFVWLSDRNFRGLKAFKNKDKAKMISSIKKDPTINIRVQHTPNVNFLDKLYLNLTKRNKIIAKQSLV